MSSSSAKPGSGGSVSSFDVVHAGASGSSDMFSSNSRQMLRGNDPLGVLVDEILLENKGCINVCPELKLPRETGVMAEIFSEKPIDVLPKVPASAPATLHSEAQDFDQARLEVTRAAENAVYAGVAVSGLGKRRALSEQAEFDVLCQRFELILSHEYDASALGRRIKGLQRDERIKLVGDALGGKAIATLRKRVAQARSLLQWCVGQGIKAFPINAGIVEGYTEAVGDSGAGFTKLMGIFEVIRFLQHVLGVEVDPSALSSPMIRGRMRKARLNRASKNQARPLAANEVLWLEAFLADPKRSLLDRYAAGCFLMAIYEYARLGDLKVVSSSRLTLVELASLSHKARTYGNAMGLRMPIVAPVKGIGPGCWGKAFVSVSNAVGRPLDTLRGPCPLLTTPLQGGVFSDCWIGNGRWSAWIRSIVSLNTPGPLIRFTGHSAKATVLSWLSKYGVAEEARTVLGHHALPSRSVVTYSSELLASPLRQMAMVLKCVENGSFRPDCTRSGMILEEHEQAVVEPFHEVLEKSLAMEAPPEAHAEECDPEQGHEQCHTDDGSASSSSSSSSTSGGLDDDLQESSSFKDPKQQMDGSCLLYRQDSGRAIHLYPRGSTEQKFVCGRAKTPERRVLQSMVLTSEWICKQCKVGRPLRDRGSLIDALDRRLKKIRQE